MVFPIRNSPRIPGYDYASPNYYYVTICTYEKECLFGSVNELNAVGKMAEECLRMIPEHNPGVLLDKYVIMLNHIHAILIIDGMESLSRRSLCSCIGMYKSEVTKRVRKQLPGVKVWQRSFFDRVLRSQSDYEKAWFYIEDNPRRWTEKRYPDN